MDDMIIKYLQGGASDEEKKTLLAWLREDPVHKKIFLQMRDIWTYSTNSSQFSTDYAHEAFLHFMQKVEEKEKQRRKKAYAFYIKIAASIALILACSAGGYRIGYNRFSGNRPVEAIVMNQVFMGKGSKGSITLPDGTLVWLNEESKLTYPARFSADSRQVKLEGEGYFEVMRNKKSPFCVETDGMYIHVLGTRFDVKNYGNRPQMETTLLSGKVKVFLPKTSQSIVLEPNETLTQDKRSGAANIEQVEAEEHIIWINEKLVFTNEKLSDILRKMKHWYGIEIVCEKDVPLNMRLSFTVRKESKEEIFKLLSLISPIRYHMDQEKIVVRKK